MQIVRTIIWVLILVGVVLFSFFNWREVEVTIWDNLVLETKVPALVIISFLLGFLPVWLYSRGVIWSLNRKIRSLEIAAKASSVSAAARESEREASEQQELAQADPVAEPQPQPEPRPEPEPAPVVAQPASEETRLTAHEASNDEIPAYEPPATAAPDVSTSDDARADDATADESTSADRPARDASTTP